MPGTVLSGTISPTKEAAWTSIGRPLSNTAWALVRALAMAVSFTLNKSIFWAIIHGVLGWIYVVYAWLFKTY